MVAWGDEETRRSERDGILRGIKKFLEVIGMFAILIWLMVSWTHNTAKHQILSFKHNVLFDVNLYLNKDVKMF